MRTCSIEGCNGKHEANGLCEKHYQKKYRKANKEYLAKKSKQYYQDNKEYCLEQNKQRYQEHKEEILKYHKQYYQDHKEEVKQYQKDHKEEIAKREKQWRKNNKKHISDSHKQWSKTPAGKASKKAARIRHRTQDEDFAREVIQQVYDDNIKKYGVLTCYLCGKPIINNDDSIDHSTPVIRDGGNNIENLGIAHLNCNDKKGTKTLKEWFKKNKTH